VATLSLWAAAWIVSLPYVWYLGRGVSVVGVAVAGSLVVGSLLALFLAGYGLLISSIVSSNRLSLSVSLFVLLALYAPTQMPTALQNSWIGELLVRLDPFTAGLRYLGRLVINGRGPGQDAGWLIGPLVAAVVAAAVAVSVAGRLSLQGGDRA